MKHIKLFFWYAINSVILLLYIVFSPKEERE